MNAIVSPVCARCFCDRHSELYSTISPSLVNEMHFVQLSLHDFGRNCHSGYKNSIVRALRLRAELVEKFFQTVIDEMSGKKVCQMDCPS